MDATRGAWLKRAVLVLLVAQNSSLVLVMRHSRSAPVGPAGRYLPSVAVALSEMLKLALCLSAIGARALPEQLRTHLLERPGEVCKVGVPAVLYTLQSYLLFVALSHVDAATFQVVYQLKTLFTALFSVALLRRRLEGVQWFSLLVLSAGVIAVQQPDAPAAGASAPASQLRMDSTGLLSVVVAAMLSGFSSVYFEKLLKHSTASMWVRNVQLGLFALPIAIAGALWSDGAHIRAHGALGGFDLEAVVVVVLNAAGGLLVAAVIKYADNIIKVFATVVSIIVSALASIPLFGLRPSAALVRGIVLVCASVVLYARPATRRPAVAKVSATAAVAAAAANGGGRARFRNAWADLAPDAMARASERGLGGGGGGAEACAALNGGDGASGVSAALRDSSPQGAGSADGYGASPRRDSFSPAAPSRAMPRVTPACAVHE